MSNFGIKWDGLPFEHAPEPQDPKSTRELADDDMPKSFLLRRPENFETPPTRTEGQTSECLVKDPITGSLFICSPVPDATNLTETVCKQYPQFKNKLTEQLNKMLLKSAAQLKQGKMTNVLKMVADVNEAESSEADVPTRRNTSHMINDSCLDGKD